ncbi:MAG: mitochondrial fission ELM1 family protein [Stellaceae bacterium]
MAVLSTPVPPTAVEDGSGPSPAVWVLHDGKAGMASQALGLAEAVGFSYIEKRLDVRLPWAHLPAFLWLSPLRAVREMGQRLTPPWPDLVIACGRNTVMPALAIRRLNGGRTLAAQIQNPGVGSGKFDLLVVPEHDVLRGARVIVTQGAVHRVTEARLAAARERFPSLRAMPRPIVSVLIGGSNRAYRLTPHRLGEIADSLADMLCAAGGSALVTVSRRSAPAALALLRDRLKGLSVFIWDGRGENPYFAFLALADAFLVTADTVSMISEAAATGKPVHILELDGGDAKFARFHATMRAAGITRPFAGRIENWTYPIPDDTARAGAALRALLLGNMERRGAGERIATIA